MFHITLIGIVLLTEMKDMPRHRQFRHLPIFRETEGESQKEGFLRFQGVGVCIYIHVAFNSSLIHC